MGPGHDNSKWRCLCGLGNSLVSTVPGYEMKAGCAASPGDAAEPTIKIMLSNIELLS